MKINRLFQFLAKMILLLWIILSVVVFIYVPGRVSFIQWSLLEDWYLLPVKLKQEMNLLTFLIDIIRSIAGISLFSLACLSLGLGTLGLMKIDIDAEQVDHTLNRLAYPGTALLLGQGIFSSVFLALAMYGWLMPTSVGALLFIGLLTGVKRLTKDFFKPLGIRKSYKKLLNKREKSIFWLAMSILFLSLLYSSSRLSYDSVAVYFSDAKLTAMTGRVHYFTNDSFIVSAFQTAIQYTALMQIFGDQTARMFSWISGFIIIIFSIALAGKCGLSRQAILLFFTFLLTSTAFLDLMGDGKVDLTSFAPVTAAIYWMVIESQHPTPKTSVLLLIGFLIGLSMVARPFNIFLAGSFVGLYYLQKAFFEEKWIANNYNRFAYSIFWIGVGLTGPILYHVIVNWALLGNPLATLSNTSNIVSTNWQWSVNPNQLLAIRLLYPLAVTFSNTPQSLGNISPLFIAFLPALLIRDVRTKITLSKDLRTLLTISMIVLSTWIFLFFTVMEIRYVLFLWIILFMPLSEITATVLERKNQLISIASSGIIIMLSVFIALRTIYISLDTYSPIDKYGNPQCNTSRFCEYLKPINEMAFLGDRVLTLGAFRYYLRTDLFACSTTHDEYQRLQIASHKSNTAFWEEVYRQGYKYIAYESEYANRHLQLDTIPNPDNAPDWIELTPIFGKPGDLQFAYKISVSNPPIEIATTCQKDLSGIWKVYHTTP